MNRTCFLGIWRFHRLIKNLVMSLVRWLLKITIHIIHTTFLETQLIWGFSTFRRSLNASRGIKASFRKNEILHVWFEAGHVTRVIDPNVFSWYLEISQTLVKNLMMSLVRCLLLLSNQSSVLGARLPRPSHSRAESQPSSRGRYAARTSLYSGASSWGRPGNRTGFSLSSSWRRGPR